MHANPTASFAALLRASAFFALLGLVAGNAHAIVPAWLDFPPLERSPSVTDARFNLSPASRAASATPATVAPPVVTPVAPPPAAPRPELAVKPVTPPPAAEAVKPVRRDEPLPERIEVPVVFCFGPLFGNHGREVDPNYMPVPVATRVDAKDEGPGARYTRVGEKPSGLITWIGTDGSLIVYKNRL